MRGHIPTTEEKKLLIENKCKDLNFIWLNKDDWIYTNWEDKTLQVEFMRENWPIKSRININLNVLFKTHGTKGLYFREDEVKSYIDWFCNEKNLTWENRDSWNFSHRTDKNIKIRCNECGKEDCVSFRILLERKVGCIECQGEQHFYPVDFFGGEKTFEIIKFRDNLKRTLCSEHNIKLIYYISIDTYNKLSKLSIEENAIIGEKELIDFLRGLEKTDHEFNIDYYLENLKTSGNDRGVERTKKYKRKKKKKETSNKKKRRLDKETCFNLAKKYNSLHELISNDGSLYTVSRNNGWITEYTWLDRSRIVPESSKRPVVRYSKEGLFIDEYSSIREASDTLGINSTSIGGICRHKEGLITAGGYIWYYKDELMKLYNEIPEKVDSYQSRTKVGELTYESCLNYAKTCKTKSEFLKKHYLAFQESNKNGWIKDYTWFSTTNKISVVRFSKEGDYIDEYESTTSAGTILGISRDLISKSCNFKRLFKGFYWRYKSDVLDENGEVLKKIEIDSGEKS